MIYSTLLNKLPAVINESYNLRYKNANHNVLSKFFATSLNLGASLVELVGTLTPLMPQDAKNKIFERNAQTLRIEFAEIIADHKNADKPVAVVFVSDADHNGAFLSSIGIANILYDIKTLQHNGYEVFPYVTDGLLDIRVKMQTLAKEVSLVNIFGHGSPDHIQMSDFDFARFYNLKLANLKEGADIILTSCETGNSKKDSLAEKLSCDNPGSTVFGASQNTFVTKTQFARNEHNISYVDLVEYQPSSNNYLPQPSTDVMHEFKCANKYASDTKLPGDLPANDNQL